MQADVLQWSGYYICTSRFCVHFNS